MSSEAQVRIGSLAMDALSDIEELYGEDCEVLDAVLLFEVLVPGEGDESATVVHRVASTDRLAVVNGILDLARSVLQHSFEV